MAVVPTRGREHAGQEPQLPGESGFCRSSVLGARVPIVLTSRSLLGAGQGSHHAHWPCFTGARPARVRNLAGSLESRIRTRAILVVTRRVQREVSGFRDTKRNEPRRLIKGQVDEIGSRPRMRAETADKTPLIDEVFDGAKVPDVPAALQTAGQWLRNSQNVELSAAGSQGCSPGAGLRTTHTRRRQGPRRPYAV